MGQYKSQYTGPQIDAGINAALNPDLAPTEGSDALITSDAVAKVQQGFATIETAATSANSYAIGDLLVWGGILYKAKTSITAGDSFVVDTNIEATTIADKLNNIDTEITSDTDTTLTGLLTGNGSKVGTKSLDTSSLTNDADHVPSSSVVKSALNAVEDDIAIRVVGNKTTYASGAAIGQYVIVSGSTITGIADGLYKAAKAIPYNTVIDSTYLTAVAGGGMNDLMAVMNSTIRNHVVRSTRYVEGEYDVTNVSTQLARIKDFLTQLDTGGLLTLFDVCIYGSGIFRFTGYIYGNKAYGAGIFFGFNNSVSWKRNENVDSVNVI